MRGSFFFHLWMKLASHEMHWECKRDLLISFLLSQLTSLSLCLIQLCSSHQHPNPSVPLSVLQFHSLSRLLSLILSQTSRGLGHYLPWLRAGRLLSNVTSLIMMSLSSSILNQKSRLKAIWSCLVTHANFLVIFLCNDCKKGDRRESWWMQRHQFNP